jgi:hypothetical protein
MENGTTQEGAQFSIYNFVEKFKNCTVACPAKNIQKQSGHH